MIRAALVAVALVAAVWGVLHIGWYGHGQIVDYGVYQQYGDRVVNEHSVPYRDFPLEYPPGALPVFVAPALVERFDYRKVFQLLMAACLVGAVLAAFAIAGPWAAVLTAVAPLALGSVVLSRFDLWPAALTVLALAAVLRRHWTLSAVLIGTAFAAKLWPAVLIPLVAIWIARSEGGRAAARWLAIAAGTAAAWFLPFVILSPGGVAHSFHGQLARPLQLESFGASLLITWHHVIGTPLYVESSYGSQNLIGPGTHTMAVVTSAVSLLALAAVYVAFARGTSQVGELLRYAVAAVAVTIAFGKVFSPQFLIWLIPLVPLVRGRRGVWATSLFFAALVLTQLWFPERYWPLANLLAATQSWELLARDLAVVALAVVLVWPRSEHDVLGEGRARVEALERVRGQVE
jgi:uncharacterized membrane protein